MISIKYLLLFFCLFLGHGSFAQTTTDSLQRIPIYKRVSIIQPKTDQINSLHALGVDLSCGAVYQNGNLQLELNEHMLRKLEERQIEYSVLVDNLSAYYERNASKLPQAREELEQLKAKSRNLDNTVLKNILFSEACEEIDWPVPNNFHLNPNSSPNSFGGCLTYEQVLQELDNMRTLFPHLISMKLDASPTNQTTIEGRTIHYVRISDNPDIDEADEPETLYQSLIHSREASSLMQMLYYMWYLLEHYQTDQSIQNLVNNQALYFIPVFNPDGFVYNEIQSPNGGGMQRKNRNITGGCTTFLDGIDLNRNSAYYWGNGGASPDNCSNTYLGTEPFSENETQIMRDFFLQHDFKLALNHHSYKNAMLHAYAGTVITNPRPDEYSKYNHDMTKYNRYAYGPSTSISSLNSGNMNDWMLGGPPGISLNGTATGTGSGKNTLAWTPENGTISEGGFWPDPSNFVPIAKRAMRMNLLAAFYSGKFAKLHDLNQAEINTTNGDLIFGVENLGQTPSRFEVTVTPITANILSVSAPIMTTAMDVLEQEALTFNYTLDPNIFSNDTISFLVTLANDYDADNVLFSTSITKVYQPALIFGEDTDNDGLSNWTAIGGQWHLTTDAYSGTSAITSTLNAPYANNELKYLALNNPLDFSIDASVLIQYYAKWDLERSFDYVQLEASTDEISWSHLCGKLTKIAAPDENNTYSQKSLADNSFQPDGTILYDGDTNDKWNLEEIIVDEHSNSFLFGANSVYLRFKFATDGSNSQDAYYNADFEGFTFDDFKCIPFDESPSTRSNELNAKHFKVYPNPVQDLLILALNPSLPAGRIVIADIYGRVVHLNANPNSTSQVINTAEWTPGVYIVKIDGIGSMKIVKQ